MYLNTIPYLLGIPTYMYFPSPTPNILERSHPHLTTQLHTSRKKSHQKENMKLTPLRPSSAAAAAHLLLLLNLYCLIPQVLSHQHQQQQQPIADSRLTLNGIPYSTRAYWMRKANQALSDLVSPCPFGAFGTVIVNHTANTGLGDLVCIGVNSIASTGNPIMHGM